MPDDAAQPRVRRPVGGGTGERCAVSDVYRVLACGLATLDVVQTIDHVPTADEKLVAADLLVAAGGPAANAAVTSTLLGVPARLVTRIGGGALGGLVAADLRTSGVDVVDLAGPGARPPVSTVLVTRATGERAVVSVNATGFERTAAAAPPEGSPDPSRPADALPVAVWDGVVVVLVDGHHMDLAIDCARAARSRGVPVVLDGGSWKPGLAELLGLVDVAVLSADFAMSGSGAGDVLRAVRDAGPWLVTQSHGAGPIEVLTAAGRVSVPVPAVEVVDTLGAGDVLHGAFAAWLASAQASALVAGAAEGPSAAPMEPALVLTGLGWAAGVASASCTARGARGWAEDATRLAQWRGELRDLAGPRGV